jgi:4-oxalocrotonate tautomerase
LQHATEGKEETMPVITIQVPENSLNAEKKADMIRKVTDAVVEVEGFPELRATTFVLIQEVRDGGWGSGGQARTLDAMKAALEARRKQ